MAYIVWFHVIRVQMEGLCFRHYLSEIEMKSESLKSTKSGYSYTLKAKVDPLILRGINFVVISF